MFNGGCSPASNAKMAGLRLGVATRYATKTRSGCKYLSLLAMRPHKYRRACVGGLLSGMQRKESQVQIRINHYLNLGSDIFYLPNS